MKLKKRATKKQQKSRSDEKVSEKRKEGHFVTYNFYSIMSHTAAYFMYIASLKSVPRLG